MWRTRRPGASPLLGEQPLHAWLHLGGQQAPDAHLVIGRIVLTYPRDDLVAAGIVERVPAPTDRRARKIIPTDQGRAVLARYEQRVSAAEAELLTGFDESEVSHPVALVGRLAMDIHPAQPGFSPCEVMEHPP